MIYPAYQLNPGDMFQVKPERVLFATGAPKDRGEARETRSPSRRSHCPRSGSHTPLPPPTGIYYSLHDLTVRKT